MDEFRREYEYDEETGVSGFLLLFLLSLLSFDMVAAVVLFTQSSMIIREFIAFISLPYAVVWGLYLLIKLTLCISLFMKKKAVVRFAKYFLMIRLCLFAVSITVMYVLILRNDMSALSLRFDQLDTNMQITYSILIAPIAYALIYSLGWIIYFKRSNRVKNFYGTNM